MSDARTSRPKRAARKCPECGREPVHRYRPFCSRRCADVDLARWLRGAYAIPGGNADADDDGDDAEAFDLARRAEAGGKDPDHGGFSGNGGAQLH